MPFGGWFMWFKEPCTRLGYFWGRHAPGSCNERVCSAKRGRRMHSPLRRVTGRRCGLLTNYFRYLLRLIARKLIVACFTVPQRVEGCNSAVCRWGCPVNRAAHVSIPSRDLSCHIEFGMLPDVNVLWRFSVTPRRKREVVKCPGIQEGQGFR